MSAYQPPSVASTPLNGFGATPRRKPDYSAPSEDVMVSLKARYEEDNDAKESSSLLGSSGSYNQAGKPAKRDYKTDSISSADVEKNKSFF